MTKKQLKTVLRYCYRLSRLVSPRTASQDGLFNFDSSICDFLSDIYLNGPEKVKIENDDFYKEVFANMEEDLGEDPAAL